MLTHGCVTTSSVLPWSTEVVVLRVGFDDQIFQAQRRGGVSRYYVELIRRLPGHGIEPVLLSTRSGNIHAVESGLLPPAPVRNGLADRVEWASWRLTGRPRTAPRPLPGFDVLHHTFTHPAYLRGWSGPRVAVVHDMTPELFPGLFPLGNPHFAKERYCREATAVIAVSQNTADDMVRLYPGVPGLAEKTHVIPLGVGDAFFERSDRGSVV